MRGLGIILIMLHAVSDLYGQQRLVDTAGVRRDTVVLRQIVVEDAKGDAFLITRVDDVEAGQIHAAKKVERVRMENVIANTSTNNARQAFSGIAGLTIWESDAVGLQLGIGGRGLNPNRTSNFTTRQNGYDISADPLGYPESYYTPPMIALDRIDVIRGAAALRYGTQFGGVVDFVFADGPRSKPLSATADVSVGSYGFASAAARVGGTTSGVNYTALYQFRRSDGWRPNSGLHQHTAYAAAIVPVSSAVQLRADYTFMTYLAQQPGGLTDRMFESDPQQSVRARNWFTVDWNLASVRADIALDACTYVRSLFFGNFSSRQALGVLDRINTVDRGGPRTMISGEFTNVGNETTIQYTCFSESMPINLLAGFRLFHGNTHQQQGDASDGSGPDFVFLNPDRLEGSDYRFPNDNAAVFAEAVVNVTEELRIVPGVRFENIVTRSEGYYALQVKDLAGNLIVDSLVNEERSRARSILLGGIGIGYRVENWELYANATMNYRSITFTDLRINNPNLVVDPNITDERGYTLDLGFRGAIGSVLSWDASLFYLRYNNRIGEILKSDQAPLFLPYRYRTNIADAYTAGVEAVADLNVTHAAELSESVPEIHYILNAALLDGTYLSSSEPGVQGKRVEYVPPYIIRTGLSLTSGALRISFMMSFTGKQYSDATNAEFTASAVTGAIPAFTVSDLTAQYNFGVVSLEASCNNVFGASYFTRRAESYPGPGIIPAEPRSFFLRMRATL